LIPASVRNLGTGLPMRREKSRRKDSARMRVPMKAETLAVGVKVL